MLAEAISAHLFQTMNRKAVREEGERAPEHTSVPLTFSSSPDSPLQEAAQEQENEWSRESRSRSSPFSAAPCSCVMEDAWMEDDNPHIGLNVYLE